MIIAIDGTSTDLSVALAAADGTLLGLDAWSSEGRQSAELLPRLLDLVEREHRSLDEVTAIAVGAGPGSFTGLRVAMALGKGLAVALGRPIVGVASLEAWLDATPDAVAAIARAGAREAYVHLRGEDAPVLADRDALAERLRDRPVVAPAELAAAFGLRAATSPRAAGEMARRAAERLGRDPGGDDLARLEPQYLRAPRGVGSDDGALARWR
ncbi:MAG TPA: tRNA (adenosine(37)-N6)-threonylcarbamoyltransferase complex dimerization subunit type 1 TsaB [Candidatus Angelobacter sp.]|nr:tRNA (adenosine(37)-N6)-threonylcarbamoyltransferase complex dimerization subunit type 1 TsaB [Candidatus Angelobacter sp.]